MIAERFWYFLGFPLYRLRPVIGMRPYGWAHTKWLQAYIRSIEPF